MLNKSSIELERRTKQRKIWMPWVGSRDEKQKKEEADKYKKKEDRGWPILDSQPD